LAAHAASDEALEEALKALKDRGYLSEARFAESFIRRQAARKGTSFIKQSLKQHQLSAELIATVTTDLQASEESRARQLWERRFGEVARETTLGATLWRGCSRPQRTTSTNAIFGLARFFSRRDPPHHARGLTRLSQRRSNPRDTITARGAWA